jgi:hypothetical protein
MASPSRRGRGPSSVRDAWRRIGSADALDPRAFPVLAAGVIAANLVGSGVPLPARLPALLAASALSLVAVFAVLLVARAVLFRDRSGADARSRPLAMLGVFVIALVVRAGVLDAVLLALGATEAPAFASRFLVSLPGMGGGLVLAAYTTSLVRSYVRDLAALRSVRAAIDDLAAAGTRAETERERTAADARERVARALETLPDGTPAAARERLADAIDGIVRPLSHELTHPLAPLGGLPAVPTPRPRGTDVLRRAMAGEPIRPLAVTAAVAVTSPPFATALWGTGPGLLFAAVTTAGTFLVLVAGRWLWRRTMGASPLRVRAVCFSLFLVLAGLLVNTPLRILPGLPADPTWLALADTALGLLYGWAGAILASLARETRRTAEALARARQEHRALLARLTGTIRAQHRAVGLALHGPVQDALHVAAARVAEAVRAGTADAALLERVRDAVARALLRVGEAERAAPPLEATLRRVADLWHGVAEVMWSISPPAADLLARDGTVRDGTTEIVREACSNAIRHADAPAVAVLVDAAGGGIRIRVRNTAVAAPGEGPAGFGTVLLDELAPGWSRTWADGVTEVRAIVPAPALDAAPPAEPHAAGAV